MAKHAREHCEQSVAGFYALGEVRFLCGYTVGQSAAWETRCPAQTYACHDTRKAHQGLYKPPWSPPHAVKIQSTPATSRSPGFPGMSRTTNCAWQGNELQASPMAPSQRADCFALPHFPGMFCTTTLHMPSAELSVNMLMHWPKHTRSSPRRLLCAPPLRGHRAPRSACTTALSLMATHALRQAFQRSVHAQPVHCRPFCLLYSRFKSANVSA